MNAKWNNWSIDQLIDLHHHFDHFVYKMIKMMMGRLVRARSIKNRIIDQVGYLRIAGLEPARLLPLGPKPSVSTNSTISALWPIFNWLKCIAFRILSNWVIVGSNHWPARCKRDALPIELITLHLLSASLWFIFLVKVLGWGRIRTPDTV